MAEPAGASRSTRKQVLLRLDPKVHAAVAKWASDELRSVNAQIEVLLRRALREAGRDPGAAPMCGPGRPRKSESAVRTDVDGPAAPGDNGVHASEG